MAANFAKLPVLLRRKDWSRPVRKPAAENL
jgi:hypothetical protein